MTLTAFPLFAISKAETTSLSAYLCDNSASVLISPDDIKPRAAGKLKCKIAKINAMHLQGVITEETCVYGGKTVLVIIIILEYAWLLWLSYTAVTGL